MGRIKLGQRFNLQHAVDCLNKYQTPHKACFEGHFSFLTLLNTLKEANKSLHVRHSLKSTKNPTSEYSCDNDPLLKNFINTLNNAKPSSYTSITFTQACHLMGINYSVVKNHMKDKSLIPIKYWTTEELS